MIKLKQEGCHKEHFSQNRNSSGRAAKTGNAAIPRSGFTVPSLRHPQTTRNIRDLVTLILCICQVIYHDLSMLHRGIASFSRCFTTSNWPIFTLNALPSHIMHFIINQKLINHPLWFLYHRYMETTIASLLKVLHRTRWQTLIARAGQTRRQCIDWPENVAWSLLDVFLIQLSCFKTCLADSSFLQGFRLYLMTFACINRNLSAGNMKECCDKLVCLPEVCDPATQWKFPGLQTRC